MIQPRHVTHRSDHLVDKNKRKDLLRAIHTFKSMSETVSAGIFVVDEAEAEAEACANPEGLSKGPRASQELCVIRFTWCHSSSVVAQILSILVSHESQNPKGFQKVPGAPKSQGLPRAVCNSIYLVFTSVTRPCMVSAARFIHSNQIDGT